MQRSRRAYRQQQPGAVEPEDARLQAVHEAAARDVARDVDQLGVDGQQRHPRQQREQPHAPACARGSSQ